ncbi:transposase [Myxococcota bacterium]|nr:transposase [Myxococcota bacterium]
MAVCCQHVGADNEILNRLCVERGRQGVGDKRSLVRQLRPPVSDDRLSLRPDGRVALQLETPWRDGTVAMLFTPEQFVARLAALIPRLGKNLARYHGHWPRPNPRLRNRKLERAGTCSGMNSCGASSRSTCSRARSAAAGCGCSAQCTTASPRAVTYDS